MLFSLFARGPNLYGDIGEGERDEQPLERPGALRAIVLEGRLSDPSYCYYTPGSDEHGPRF